MSLPVTSHFRILDGLRGIAAIAVVAYHFGNRSNLPYLMPRGYLAVDFFFVLSGLVLGHAYIDRLRAGLSASDFVLLRLIRLWPMLVPGTLFGAAIEFWRPHAGNPLNHAAEVVLAVILGCAAIPWPFATSMEQTIFPINGPVWSLFFELVANFIFLMVAKRRHLRIAALMLIVASGIGLLSIVFALGVDVGATLDNWPGGFPRVVYSFFVGVMLSGNLSRFPRLSVWVFPVVLVGIFMVPVQPGTLSSAFDLAVVLILFPLLVGSAANSDARRVPIRLCNLLGEVSYPLYALHYPIIRAICFIINRYSLSVSLRLTIAGVSVALICYLSWLVLRFYDRPLRRYLTGRLLSARTPETSDERLSAAHKET